jgi:hypothetical protein
MAEIDELEVIQQQINQISIKVNQALRIRKKILDRIKGACEILVTNPHDTGARDRLMINLDREKKFLDIIRKGSKEGISALKNAKRHMGKLEAPDDVKASMETLIANLIDVMGFTQKKIKMLEKRVKQGERLEYRDYADTHIKNFLETLDEEKKLDIEICARLKGQLPKIVSPFQALTQRLGIASIGGMVGLFGGGMFASQVQGGEVMRLVKAGVNRTAAAWGTIPISVNIMIIAAGVSFIMGLLYASAKAADEEDKIEAEVKKILAKEQASK